MCDLDSYKDIYRNSNTFLKTQFYLDFRVNPIMDTFSVVNPKEHAARRRLHGQLYTNTNLREKHGEFVFQKYERYLVFSKSC